MSYTFSRRDFMKYSAVAAVAVAGSGMFTGCSASNPNRPYGTYKNADCKLTFGGKSGGILGFGGTEDRQILKAGATYSSTTKTLLLPFEHYAVSQGCSCTAANYQIDITYANGKNKSYRHNSDFGDTVITKVSITDNGGSAGMKVETTYSPNITVTGIDFTGAKKVEVRYFPRHNALGRENDTYSDVYATWNITSLFTTT